jgi:16S rRNA (cytidine1402-2'-O)-methyltransferase
VSKPAKPDVSATGAPARHAPERLLERVRGALVEALANPPEPGLYIVATPIGNLGDISLRALAVLEGADTVYCEDTRHSRKLLSHFGISQDLRPYHEHNAAQERPRILEQLGAGKAVALVADAGTPLVSDPGYKLARAALEIGLKVVSIPGPSAALAALTSAGLPTDHFFFEGFLPPKREARRKRLEALKDIPATLVFYEAPSRLVAMLTDTDEILGPREGAVAKELTKLHEAVQRGPLGHLVEKVETGFAEKGEFVVLVGPPQPAEITDDEIEAQLNEVLTDHSVRDAARDVAAALGVSKSRVYTIALALKGKGGE